MADTLTETGALYSPLMGLVYIFNLIVGTGALAMPLAFATAGWLVSVIVIIMLAFTSYLTVTFVVETMAVANAVLRLDVTSQDSAKSDLPATDSTAVNTGGRPPVEEDETRPLLLPNTDDPTYGNLPEPHTNPRMFEISKRVEMGQMASMFFDKWGARVFYFCIAVYLYGDLAIYSAAVPKSLRDVACTYTLNGSTCNLTENDPCWESAPDISRMNSYRIFLAIYTLLLGPFLFFNVQKTKLLQVFTSLMRWLAFCMMIILAVIRLAQGGGEGHPPVADLSAIPNLFGVCVYAFMCHHSLPSLATPIRNKSRIFSLLAVDYILILVFYCLLSFTGIFCFAHLEDLYTLNFRPNSCTGGHGPPITNIAFIQYFLALFPVIVLSTNFPIIGITLRNNLKTLFHREGHTYPWIVDRLVFPLAAIIPPTVISLVTNNVQILVGVTGSYAGASIQYFVPAALVFFCRRHPASTGNKHQSPFLHTAWVVLVVVWAVVCLVLVTVNHILNGFSDR